MPNVIRLNDPTSRAARSRTSLATHFTVGGIAVRGDVEIHSHQLCTNLIRPLRSNAVISDAGRLLDPAAPRGQTVPLHSANAQFRAEVQVDLSLDRPRASSKQ
jgi:hypothetical protein